MDPKLCFKKISNFITVRIEIGRLDKIFIVQSLVKIFAVPL